MYSSRSSTGIALILGVRAGVLGARHRHFGAGDPARQQIAHGGFHLAIQPLGKLGAHHAAVVLIRNDLDHGVAAELGQGLFQAA